MPATGVGGLVVSVVVSVVPAAGASVGVQASV